MTRSILIFIVIAAVQGIAAYYAKKAKEKQAAADAVARGEGAGTAALPLDGTRPVQADSVKPMTERQARGVALLIEQGRTIEAIMALRSICQLGLAEARDVVQQFSARGFPAHLIPVGSAATMSAPSADSDAATSLRVRQPSVAPPPIPQALDAEARSQEGEEEESADALHSVEHVRQASARIAHGLTRAGNRVPLSAAPTQAGRQQAAVARESEAAAAMAALRTRAGARQAFVMSEVLGPPRAFRPLG